ncbi:MAG: hypothetical protein QM726_11115 [Chitinophagaceae bacterium]
MKKIILLAIIAFAVGTETQAAGSTATTSTFSVSAAKHANSETQVHKKRHRRHHHKKMHHRKPPPPPPRPHRP